ncbi:MAG: hypothetical protein ABI175_16645 [Polyangiales bacterium]
MRIATKTLLSGLLLAAASPAFADDQPVAKPVDAPVATVEPQLPPPLWPKDPEPEAAPPAPSAPGVVQQAGIGGEVGYARKGVLELGGSAGLMLSSQFRNINVAPSLGWFVADNFELSAIVAVSNIKAGGVSATTWTAVAEPSYHLAFNRTMFGFLGMGVGAAYESQMGAGLALAPRLGANFLVGRSGVLTPSLQYMYVMHGQMTTNDVTTVALTNAMSVNVGYTAMW